MLDAMFRVVKLQQDTMKKQQRSGPSHTTSFGR